MTLFQEATNQQAYLKMGLLGFQGTGKTFTAGLIARGLHKYIKAKKPVCFVDSETGSDFLIKYFTEEKIKLMTYKTRSFAKLLDLIDEAEQEASILIIDSISHFWIEVVKSYLAKKELKFMTMRHWMPVKQTWADYTNRFVNSRLHIIIAGRAMWEYDFIEDEEKVKEIAKVGTKMRGESEMGFEPSLVMEMESVKSEKGKIGSGFIQRGWIIKDRSNTLQGKLFDNPVFNNILPHIQSLNLGGEHIGVNTDENSTALFDSPNNGNNLYKRREIALENIENELVMKYPGQDKASKQEKIKILRETFNNDSWKAISEMHPNILEAGLQRIKNLKLMNKESEVKEDDGKN